MPTTPSPDLLFYDGGCGLCHRTVTFALARDRDGSRFRFAPLGGSTFTGVVAPEAVAELPDSIVLRTADGRTLVRSGAVLHILERLGGGWRATGPLLGLLPRWLLDAAYDGVARIRARLFARPEESCPLLPPELRGRVLP